MKTERKMTVHLRPRFLLHLLCVEYNQHALLLLGVQNDAEQHAVILRILNWCL